MKKCEGCGAYYSDFDRVCPHCGRADDTMPEPPAEPEQAPAAPVNLEKPQNMPVNLLKKPAEEPEDTGAAENGEEPFSPYRVEQRLVPIYPMKWHNFLVVILLIGGIMSIIGGVGLIAGAGTGIYDDLLVDTNLGFSSAKNFLQTYGVISAATGAFQIFVYTRLKKFRKNALILLFALYAISLVTNVIISPSIRGILLPGLFIFVNWMYYSKRKALFVN